MNSRPYYAITLLLVVLVAVVQLMGTSQPVSRQSRRAALAQRPYVPVLKPQEQSPLFALRHRQPPGTKVAGKLPNGFVDHAAMLSALFSVSTSGVGNPLVAVAASPVEGEIQDVHAAIAAAKTEEDLAPETAVPRFIGFEEFTAVVNDLTVVGIPEAENAEAEENEASAGDDLQFAYQTGCGLNRITGEVYTLPQEQEAELLLLTDEVRSSTSIWTILVRSCQTWWMQAFASSSFSAIPSVRELMGWEFRNQMLR